MDQVDGQHLTMCSPATWTWTGTNHLWSRPCFVRHVSFPFERVLGPIANLRCIKKLTALIGLCNSKAPPCRRRASRLPTYGRSRSGMLCNIQTTCHPTQALAVTLSSRHRHYGIRMQLLVTKSVLAQSCYNFNSPSLHPSFPTEYTLCASSPICSLENLRCKQGPRGV